jgi:hypothetical protein
VYEREKRDKKKRKRGEKILKWCRGVAVMSSRDVCTWQIKPICWAFQVGVRANLFLGGGRGRRGVEEAGWGVVTFA